MSIPPGNSNIQVSQGFEVLAPKSGPAFPIPCSEWDYLKERLNKVSTVPWLFQTLGALSLGATVSTFITILVDALPSTPIARIIAWSVVAVSGIVGVAFLILAGQQRRLQLVEVADVIRQMELIEQRYERAGLTNR